MPTSFDATLYLCYENPYSVKLTIFTEIALPEEPDDAYLAPNTWNNTEGMSHIKELFYHGKVSVAAQYPIVGAPRSVIQTIQGSGRGQTQLFDILVGPRIAKLRYAEGRRMRYSWRLEDTISLTVTREEVARIEELAEGFYQSGDENDFINVAQLASTA
jgi:hypothetical protein